MCGDLMKQLARPRKSDTVAALLATKAVQEMVHVPRTSRQHVVEVLLFFGKLPRSLSCV